MYIKISNEKMPLKDFHKTTNHILFAFNQDIESETFSESAILEMYSDDDIFLSKYYLIDYNVEVNTNELYLKNPNIEKDVDTFKQEKIDISKQLLADWIENNPMLYTDGKYYSVTAEKQSLLNGNLASYERAKAINVEYPLKWNSTGSECVSWDYTDLLALSLTIAGYVAPKVSKQQAIELQIKACTTVDELNEIVISYD